MREQSEGVRLRKGFDGGTEFGRLCDTVVVRKGFHDEKGLSSMEIELREKGLSFFGERKRV